MNKARDIKGNIVDENKLTDSQSLLLNQVRDLNMGELEKHGDYFVWARLRESKKTAMKSSFETDDGFLSLIASFAKFVEDRTGRKFSVVLIPLDEFEKPSDDT